jgi:hypothetical protein
LLPFLKDKSRKQQTGVIINTVGPVKEPEQDLGKDALEACAMDLIIAVHTKDVKAVAEAIQSAFQVLESMPHDEVSAEPHSYDSQNQKAGESR